MATFDFIEDPKLRQSLEHDSEALIECMKVGAWKAVHVLAAGIIQSTLIDHLHSSGLAAGAGLRELSGGDLLELCRRQGVLSENTIDLSEHIRPYLDRLRPGTPLLSETPADENAARIAQALVEIVVNEVAAQKRSGSLRAAEQILARLRNDPGSFRVDDLQRLEEPDRSAVKDFLFANLARRRDADLLDAAQGMGPFLTSERDARAFFVPLVSGLTEATTEEQRTALLRRIKEEYSTTSPDNRRVIRSWLRRVISSLANLNKAAAAAILQKLVSEL